MLTTEQRAYIKARVEYYVTQARGRYNMHYAAPFVTFFGSGRAAGTADFKTNTVSFNTAIAATNFDKFDKTVAHEVAHIVAGYVFNDYGHGRHWKRVMQFFGFTPDRCHNYDMTGVKVKRQKLFDYTCACPGRTHKLTTVRHNRVQNGYYKDLRCTRCNRQVAFAGNQNQLAMAA